MRQRERERETSETERERPVRQREREREDRERERAAKLAHALCFDAIFDVFVNEEFKIPYDSETLQSMFRFPDFEKFGFRAMTFR